MKLRALNKSKLRSRHHSAGFTLIEISLVIALLLGLVSVVFMGLGSYRKGADKAKCKLQLAAVQKAVRSQANMQNLAIGVALPGSNVFGAGKMIETTPVCPSGGSYSWIEKIPAIGAPYGNCDHVNSDGITSHVLAPADTIDW